MRAVVSPGIRTALVVYVVAVAARAVVLAMSGQDPEVCCLSSDSYEYLRLAQGQLFNLARTPGYPAFLWLSERLFGSSPMPVLWLQVFITSLTPALIAFFATLAVPRYPAAPYVAGILSALSFTGLTLSHFILSEAVFVPLVTAALVTTWIAAKSGRTSLILLAGVLGGIAFLVKPVFVVWFMVLPILLFLFAERQKISLRALAAGALIAAAFPLGWSIVNRVHSGVFTTSSIGTATGCIYLAGRTEAIVAQPSGPTREDIRTIRARLVSEARSLQTEADGYRYYSDCLRSAVVSHPVAAVQAYGANAIEDLPRPFDGSELRSSTGAIALPQFVRFAMARFSDLVYLLAIAGAVRLILAGRTMLVAGLALLFAAIWLPSALSHAQGARLMYPAESILLLLAGVGVSPALAARA